MFVGVKKKGRLNKMPYDSNNKLPDTVKVLPAEAQTIWRNAFNSADKSGKDEQQSSQIAWGAVKNAGWKKQGDNWVKDNTDNTHEFDVEVMSTGVWNGDKFTVEDLNNIKSNFYDLKDLVKPFIKLGHNMKQEKDGSPAMGWVKELKVVGEKLTATLTQVPDIVYKAIRSGRYKRLSAEVYFNFKDKAGNIRRKVLRALALLGADVPAVDNLADLDAFLTQSILAGQFEDVKSYSWDVENEKELITIESFVNPEKDKEKKMGKEDEAKEYKDKAVQEEQKRKEAEKEAREYKEKLEAKEKEEKEKVKKASEEEFTAFTEKMVKDGKLTPALRDQLVKDFSFEEEKGFFVISFEAFKKFVSEQEKFIEFKELGSHEGENLDQITNKETVQETVDRKTKKYALDNKLSYGDALTAVLEQNPKLADKYYER